MYLLLAVTYWWTAWYIPPLSPFSTINKISISVKRSNFTLIFLEAACHANPGAKKNLAGSSSYISRCIFL